VCTRPRWWVVPAVLPVSTYRVQLHGSFTFDDATWIVDYVAGLEITHLSCTPYLQAAEDSTHGYDVVDSTTTGSAASSRNSTNGPAPARLRRGHHEPLPVAGAHVVAFRLPQGGGTDGVVARRRADLGR
jgi:hypothetical protein